MDEENVEKQTREYLLKIGNFLASSCSPASRYYISNLEKRCPENSNFLKTKDHCKRCGSKWTKDNVSIYMKKRPRLTKKMKKLMEVENWKKSKKLKKKINKFCGATNKLVYKCLICKQKTFNAGTKKMKMQSSRPSQQRTDTPNREETGMRKRRDWNAGLFISPCQLDTSEKSSESKQDSETPVKNKETNWLDNKSPITPEVEISKNSNFQNKATPKTVISTPELNTSETQSSSKKRKKTLLAQILSKEQNKKKKTSLASFLQTL